MVRNQGWLLVAVAALGLGAGACKKDDAKTETSDKKVADDKKTGDDKKVDDKKSDDKKAPTDNKVEAKPDDTKKTDTKAEAAPPANPNADDLSLLPVDSEAVIGINFKQLSSSALWKEFVAPKLMTGKATEGLDKFKKLCGFDPMEQLASMSVGMKNLGDKDKPEGAFVVHGFDKTKSMACFSKEGVKEVEKDGTKVTVDGDVVIIHAKDGTDLGFTFVNDSTALAVLGSKAKDAAGVKSVASGGSALKTSPAFVEMYGKINTTDSIWVLMNGSSKAFDKMPMGFKLKAVFGSLNVTDGLTLDGRVRFESADQAAQLAGIGKSQVAQAAQFFDKIDITADGADVKLSVAMSNAKLKSLLQMVGGKLGKM